MEKLSILTADLLDIIFEYRNKLYGAYELRRSYPKRIAYAMAGTIFICLLFVGGTMLANNKQGKLNVELATDFELQKLNEDPKPEPPPPPPPPKQEIPQIESIKFTPPEIVKDELVKEDDEIQDLAKLDEAKISTVSQEGVKDDGVVAPPVETVRAIVAAPKPEEDLPFTVVAIEARFPGDLAGWAKYLKSHLNSDIPNQNGAPAGNYKVIVSFIVNKEGMISEVRAENDPGYGTAAEAVRVIQKGPNWIPAVQNGRNVIYRQKQAITFQVVEE